MKWEEEEEQGDKANNGEERNSVLTPFRREEGREVEEHFLFHFVSGIRARTIDATVLSVGGGERGGLEKK